MVYLEIAKDINFLGKGFEMLGCCIIRTNFKDTGIFVTIFNRDQILFEQDCEPRLRGIDSQAVRLEPLLESIHYIEKS